MTGKEEVKTILQERDERGMDVQVRSFYMKDDGQVPNNPDLPVIFYQNAYDGDTGPEPDSIRGSFAGHGWTNSWTGDVYDYHHYHTNTHEVLGVVRGRATMLLGGDAGERLEVKPGDVILLPAGTAHRKLDSSDEFEVVGAYPDGMQPDLKERDPKEKASAKNTISNVPVPGQDPVFGKDEQSPMFHKWIK